MESKSKVNRGEVKEHKMTRTELSDIAGVPYRLDYCEVANILLHLQQRGEAVKKGYNSGLYGWNWTAYLVTTSDGVRFTVCTGFRPYGREIADHKKIKEMEDRERLKKGRRITAKRFLKILEGC